MKYTVSLKGWQKGVDNIHADMELPDDTLRGGVNVDIYDSGKLKRRRGSTETLALVGSHSLWSHEDLDVAYYVAGTTMYQLESDLVTATAIVTGLMANRAVAYHYLNGEVFWSNGITSGRIRSGVNTQWGIETPSSIAVLAAGTGGLLAGTYQVVTTFKNAAGEESGASNALSITLAATGGIDMTGMPPASSAEIVYRCVYATVQNGGVLYKIAQLPVAQTTYSITNINTQTTALRTQDFAPMPAGTIIAYCKGRLFVAIGPYVFYSEPLRYGLYNPVMNFFMFSENVSILLGTENGVYIAAEKTYFVSNPGADDMVQHTVFNFGGVRGTGVYMPKGDDYDVAWFCKRGQVVAKNESAKLLTDKSHAPGIMISGVSLVREQQGIRQVVTITHQSGPSPLAYVGE